MISDSNYINTRQAISYNSTIKLVNNHARISLSTQSRGVDQGVATHPTPLESIDNQYTILCCTRMEQMRVQMIHEV